MSKETRGFKSVFRIMIAKAMEWKLPRITRTSNRKIITLCGSTKFKKEFEEIMLAESLKGHIVFGPAGYNHADNLKLLSRQKELVDQIHLDKVAISDEILVINKDGYIGESTKREIEYAECMGKKVRYFNVETKHANNGRKV